MNKITNRVIEAAQNGDIDAIETIINEYAPVAYYQAIKVLRNKEAAEDCAQEALDKLVNSFNEFDINTKNFNAWVYKLIDNYILNYLRKMRRYQSKVINSNEYTMHYQSEQSLSKDTEVMLSQIEKILGERDYKVLVYKIIYNYKFCEISKIFNIKNSQVKKIYYNSLKEAQRYVRGEYEE